jgi:hypothetical protein
LTPLEEVDRRHSPGESYRRRIWLNFIINALRRFFDLATKKRKQADY